MARRIQVNRLEKDELEYELAVRGVGTGTVEEMRKRLAFAMRLENGGDSLRYPKHPFSFDQDALYVQNKIKEVTELLKDFNDGKQSGPFAKLQTKLTHILGRAEAMDASDEDQQKVRGDVLAELLSLMDSLYSRADQFEARQNQVPPSLSVLGQSFYGNLQDAPGSSPIATGPQPSTSDNVSVKSVLPSKWNLTFSGDKKGLSLAAFFERAEELMVARNVSKEILFNSGIDLFTGRAYQFYQECRKEVGTWDDLVRMFKEEYLPADYNEKLFEEIKKRTMGSDETIGTYLAVMSKYFERLNCPISEETKIKIIMRNITPFYQSQLALVDISSFQQLRALCRRLETRREAVENFAAPSRRVLSLEPDLAYLTVEENESSCSAAAGTINSAQQIICFRCNQPGHRAIGCAAPKNKFCYKCKREGFTVRTCPSCSQSGNATRRS